MSGGFEHPKTPPRYATDTHTHTHTYTHIDITHRPFCRYSACKSTVSLCTTWRHVGSGGLVPVILNLGTRWGEWWSQRPYCRISSERCPVPTRRDARYPLSNGRDLFPESVWTLWRRAVLPLSASEPMFLGSPARGLVTILIELIWFSYNVRKKDVARSCT